MVSLIAIALLSLPAQDMVIMRRVIAPPTRTATTPATPTPTPPATDPNPTATPTPGPKAGIWTPGDWTYVSSNTCLEVAEQRRSVACLADGDAVPDAQCAGAKPIVTQTVERLEGCGYSWHGSGYGAYSSTCSTSATQSQTVTCRRSDGKDGVDVALCSNAGERPATTTAPTGVYSSCAYSWALGTWSEYGSLCSTSAYQTRTVDCHRAADAAGDHSVDGTVSDAACAAALGTEKPALQGEHVDNTEAVGNRCQYDWHTTIWGPWSDSACSASATRARTVTCIRSETNVTGPTVEVADERCAATVAKPEATQTGQYASCSYKVVAQTPTYSSTCSETPTVTTTYQCVRQDGGNTVVESTAATCGAGATNPTSTSGNANYSGCGATLLNGGFESALANWNQSNGPTVSSTVAHGGSSSIRMTNAQQLRQYIQTVNGRTYTMSYWVYGVTGQYMNAYATTTVNENTSLGTTTAKWVQRTGTFVGNGGVVAIGFYMYSPSNSGAAYLDDVVIN